MNLNKTIEKIIPLLEARLRDLHMADWKGNLRIDAGEQKIALKINASQVKIINDSPGKHKIIGGPEISRLLIGSDEPEEIIGQEEMNCTGDAFELARVLFPNLHPVMSHWNEF